MVITTLTAIIIISVQEIILKNKVFEVKKSNKLGYYFKYSHGYTLGAVFQPGHQS